MRKYFLHTDNGQEGPLSLEELKNRELKHDTPVWCKDFEDWTHAGKIEELKDIVTITSLPQLKESITDDAMLRPIPNTVGGLPVKRSKGKLALVAVLVVVTALIAVIVYNQRKEKQLQVQTDSPK